MPTLDLKITGLCIKTIGFKLEAPNFTLKMSKFSLIYKLILKIVLIKVL